MAKTDDEFNPRCEFFEEAGGNPPTCMGEVTKVLRMDHPFKNNPKQAETFFMCEPHAAEAAREKGFLEISTLKRSDNGGTA